MQPRLFRHTYLQQLVNLGKDIFLVQELADHWNVQTTIDSYVRVHKERLREAVDKLAERRVNSLGMPSSRALPIASQASSGIRTNDCTNPQVLALGREGCDCDRLCYDCDHYAADRSSMLDIEAEIHTCDLTLARVEAEGLAEQRGYHVAVLRERRAGWRRMLDLFEGHPAALEPDERRQVEVATDVVQSFRNRVRSGALNTGVVGLA